MAGVHSPQGEQDRMASVQAATASFEVPGEELLARILRRPLASIMKLTSTELPEAVTAAPALSARCHSLPTVLFNPCR